MKNPSFQLCLLLAIVLVSAVPASAQLSSTESTVALSAVLPESLTVSLAPGATTFNLTSASASNPGNTSITATTTWTFNVTRTAVALYGYFSSASAALVHTDAANTVDIPSARVEVSVNGGANAAFNQSVAFSANAGRQLFSQAITIPTASGSRSDTLALNINLSSYTLPSDTYTGTLRIRAQATP